MISLAHELFMSENYTLTLSQQGLILVHTEKLKSKGPIAEKLVTSDISHVALASVLLGENPSEEVDDYDNYYYNKKNIY